MKMWVVAWLMVGLWAGDVLADGITPSLYEPLFAGDQRYINSVRPIENALERVIALTPVYFRWNGEIYPTRRYPEGRQIGFIAQDVEKVFPELIRSDTKGLKYVHYYPFIAILTEAVKEQHAKLEAMRQRHRELEQTLIVQNDQLRQLDMLLRSLEKKPVPKNSGRGLLSSRETVEMSEAGDLPLQSDTNVTTAFNTLRELLPSGLALTSGASFYDADGFWFHPSDRRLKKDIRPLEDPLERILKLKGVRYYRNARHYPNSGRVLPGELYYGFVAQDVAPVFPELVRQDAEGRLSVACDPIVSILTEALKEQMKEIRRLETETAALRQRAADVHRRIRHYTDRFQSLPRVLL